MARTVPHLLMAFLLVPAFPQSAEQKAPIDIPALIRQVMANQRRHDAELTDYTSETRETIRDYAGRRLLYQSVTTSETFQSRR